MIFMEQSTLSFKKQYSSLAPILFKLATKLTFWGVYLKKKTTKKNSIVFYIS